jgi:isochorismate synthase
MAHPHIATKLEYDLDSLCGRLRAAVDAAMQTFKDRPTRAVVSATADVAVPWSLIRRLAGTCPTASERMYWCLPSERTCHLALGAAAVILADGENRSADVRRQMHQYGVVLEATDTVGSVVQESRDATAVWFGGMSFDIGERRSPWVNWPEAKFVLPHLWICRTDAGCRVTAMVVIGDGQDVEAQWMGLQRQVQSLTRLNQRDADGQRVVQSHGTAAEPGVDRKQWEWAVARTAEDIRHGRYEKVVLARYELVEGIRKPLSRVLETLEATYPDSQVFAIWNQGQCFLAASPERLVSVSGSRVDVDCLAGTIGRGSTPDEDAALERKLLASAKDRHEHEVVRACITEQLQAARVRSIDYPKQPLIKKLANVQHLHTPIVAVRNPEQTVLDLVERLHPTPAVAGMPRDQALQVIRQREGMDRGWYAGPVGWMNARGEGQFAVALRCALVMEDNAYLFAGAGIMGDSDPASEWQETKMKLRAVQSALMANNGGVAE